MTIMYISQYCFKPIANLYVSGRKRECLWASLRAWTRLPLSGGWANEKSRR